MGDRHGSRQGFNAGLLYLQICKKIIRKKNGYKIIRFNVIDSTNPHVLSYQYSK
jgi:hypothetical protein